MCGKARAMKVLLLTSFGDEQLRLRDSIKQALAGSSIELLHPADAPLGSALSEILARLRGQADVLVADSVWPPEVISPVS
jgi:hypothetical protein